MTDALPIPKGGDWRHRYAFYLADGSAEDISTATASIVLTHQATGAQLTLALGSGLAVAGAINAVDPSVVRATKSAWPAGFTTAEIRLAWPNGFEEVAAVDRLNVHAPGVPTDGGLTTIIRSPDGTRILRVGGGPPGLQGPAAVWGAITGTLGLQGDLAGALASKQGASGDLTDLAALSPADGDLMQRSGGHWVTRTLASIKAALGLNLVNNTADADKPISALTQAALDLRLALSAVDADPTLAANSNSRVASQAAVKTYMDGLIAAQDAMVFKGTVDCSADPDYPAADRGHTYRVSVAGKIGGAAGVDVEAGDILICLTDGTAAGDQAARGSSWSVIQANLDGALLTSSIGIVIQAYSAELTTLAGLTPANGDMIARLAGAWAVRTLAQVKADLGLNLVDNTADANKPVSGPQQTALDGKLALSALDTDPTLAANSNSRVASQAAVKTYVDGLIAAQDAMVFKGLVNCSANPNYPAADRGHTYRVSAAGKIGGGAGVNVETGDILICQTDGTAAGNQATVGANWGVIQANLDGALLTTAIGVTVQAYNADVAAIAALTPVDGDTLLRVAGAWVNRTMAQLKTALALVKADVGLGNLDNTSDANKPISTAQQAGLDAKLPLAAGHPGYRSARWYTTPLSQAPTTTAAGADQLIMIPFPIGGNVTATDIGVSVSAFVAASSYKVGIYSNLTVAGLGVGYPNAKLAEATLSTAANGNISGALSANVALAPGWYWLAGLGSHNPTLSAIMGTEQIMAHILGHTLAGVFVSANHGLISSGYGYANGLPATAPAGMLYQNGALPLIAVKAQ
jgi:hypothetical protein